MVDCPLRRPWSEPLRPWALLLIASVLFRLPALVNADAVNADAAVVGLQAMHLLRGERSWFLWGSGYQTSVDSHLAAFFFALFGPSSLALVLSAFTLYLLLTGLAYATLRRHLGAWSALLATAPLVFTPSIVHGYALVPPRQASLTLAFVSLWLLDGASDPPRGAWRFAPAMACASLACFADPYAMLFWPPLALFALLGALGANSARTLALWRLAAGGLGALVGAVPLGLLLASPRAEHGKLTLTAERLAHNVQLLLDPCLPWALSLRVYAPAHARDYVPWPTVWGFAAVQWAGVGGLAALCFVGVALWRQVAVPLRRLFVFGIAVSACTVGGFVASVMVMDLFSTRYLTAMVLVLPFVVAPAAAVLGDGRFGIALAPYLIAAAVAGWLGHHPFVDGFAIVSPSLAGADEELRLCAELTARGIRHAVADYWASYRLTFLSRERLVVVPLHAEEDRYGAYRRAFEAAPVVAYVYDPFRSREPAESLEQNLAIAGIVSHGAPERLVVGRLTALLIHRRAAGRSE